MSWCIEFSRAYDRARFAGGGWCYAIIKGFERFLIVGAWRWGVSAGGITSATVRETTATACVHLSHNTFLS